MATFSCATCGYHVKPGDDYLTSPCATCKLAVEYTNTKRAAMFDSSGYDGQAEEEENEAFARIDENLEAIGNDQPQEQEKYPLTLEQLALLKKSIEDQLMVAISGVLIRLLKLGQISPIMLELVVKKMNNPLMSYSELGASMKTPFSKQNVLYHLKHAVEIIPELASALLTDTRFSAGRYALKTLAQRSKQEYAEKRIQGILYGENDPAFTAYRLKELNAILQAPFLLDKEALDFNPYIKDETE